MTYFCDPAMDGVVGVRGMAPTVLGKMGVVGVPGWEDELEDWITIWGRDYKKQNEKSNLSV